jgi:hypothetical protein
MIYSGSPWYSPGQAQMDNIRIDCYPRTAAQVLGLYNGGH